MSDDASVAIIPAASFMERATASTPASAEPQRLDPVPPFLVRQGLAPTNPFGITPTQWRSIVARAPVVSLCIRTLSMQVCAIPWKIVADNNNEVDFYTELIDNANAESFDLFVERVVEDMLSVPFGGAVEPVRTRDGDLAGLYHVDGGSLFPTYDQDHPYVQVDPDNSLRRVYYTDEQLERVVWAPMADMRNYGWSKPPVMEVFGAVEALMRSDVFYSQFLANTPEAGILDLMDMKKADAEEWLKSWQQLMMGIDPLKIPVLYQHEHAAQFIAFARTPSEISLPEIVKRYAEIVVAAFGMNISDLGLFEHTNTLAGTSRMQETSKRQGLGSIMRKLARTINRSLPKGVKFEWDPVDETDRLKKAQSQKARADTLKILATPDPTTGQAIFSLEAIRKQAISDGLMPAFTMEDIALLEKQLADEQAERDAKKAEALKAQQEAMASQAPAAPAAPAKQPDNGPDKSPPGNPAGSQKRADIERVDTGETEYPENAPYAKQFSRTVEDALTRARKRVTRDVVEQIVSTVLPRYQAATERAGVLPPEIETLILTELANHELLALDLNQTEVLAAFARAYEEGLLTGANDVQRVLYAMGQADATTVSMAFNLTNGEALDALEVRALALVRNLEEGTRSYMMTAFRDAFTEHGPGSARELTNAIHANLTSEEQGAFGKKRLEGIVHHEMNFVHSAGRLEQYRAIGLTKKRWNAIDGIACDICAANEGDGAVPLDHSFRSVFGPTQHPPGHPKVCHCHLSIDPDEVQALADGGTPEFWDGGDDSISFDEED